MKSITYIFAIALLALMSCGKKAAEASAETQAPAAEASDIVSISPDQAARMALQTTQAAPRNIERTIAAHGLLDVPPQNLVSISAPYGGFLKSTPLLQGSRVQRGQQIALLQDPEYVTMQQQYLEDRSQLAFLQSEWERQQTLSDAQVNARKTLEKAKADLETMKARLAGERAKLEILGIDLQQLETGKIVKEAAIYAPITGYVTQVNVNIGTHVNPEDVLFKIADTEHLHAELTVYEQDLPYLAIGQRVHVRVSNEPNWRNGTIHLVGREVGPDRSTKVHVHLDDEDRELVPGTYLEAQIVAQAQAQTAIPDEAIVHFGGGTHVFVQLPAENGMQRYQMMEMKTVGSDSGYTAVEWPTRLDPKATIVGKGSYTLLTKLKNSEEE